MPNKEPNVTGRQPTLTARAASQLRKPMSTDLIAPLLNFAGTAAVAVLAASLGWWAKKSDWKRDIYRQKVATRQRLYADFLAETDRLALKSMDEKTSKVGEFHPMTRYFSEIELLSAVPVNAAKAVCANILESHSEIPQGAASYAELKAAFVAAARKEIDEYER